MKIAVSELIVVHKELLASTKDSSPLWYEIGKNLPIVERALKQIEDLYNADRKIIIEKFALKDDKGEYKFVDEINEQTRKPQKVHDFGSNKAEATKLLNALYISYFEKNEDGTPATVDVVFFQAKKENAEKAKEQSLSGLAYSIEYLGI